MGELGLGELVQIKNEKGISVILKVSLNDRKMCIDVLEFFDTMSNSRELTFRELVSVEQPYVFSEEDELKLVYIQSEVDLISRPFILDHRLVYVSLLYEYLSDDRSLDVSLKELEDESISWCRENGMDISEYLSLLGTAKGCSAVLPYKGKYVYVIPEVVRIYLVYKDLLRYKKFSISSDSKISFSPISHTQLLSECDHVLNSKNKNPMLSEVLKYYDASTVENERSARSFVAGKRDLQVYLASLIMYKCRFKFYYKKILYHRFNFSKLSKNMILELYCRTDTTLKDVQENSKEILRTIKILVHLLCMKNNINEGYLEISRLTLSASKVIVVVFDIKKEIRQILLQDLEEE